MRATLAPFIRIMLRPMALPPFRHLPSAIAWILAERHPEMFKRLGEHAHKRFGLAPTDLPIGFILEPKWPRPMVTAVANLPATLDARISGPIAALIGLVDGTYDGDALFFSRDLAIEGDIEAVVALRNAIDGAELDFFGDVVAPLGPLAQPAELVLRALHRAIDDRGTGARRQTS